VTRQQFLSVRRYRDFLAVPLTTYHLKDCKSSKNGKFVKVIATRRLIRSVGMTGEVSCEKKLTFFIGQGVLKSQFNSIRHFKYLFHLFVLRRVKMRYKVLHMKKYLEGIHFRFFCHRPGC
jgi:hypothetical protein